MIAPAFSQETSVTSRDLLVGCVADNAPKYLEQALRLVQSIRWFGGDLAQARLLICAVGGITDSSRKELERYGAEVRVVQRFHEKNGSANRLRFFEEAWEADRELLLVLDCDTLVVRDPLPLMRHGRVQAKIESLPTVTHDVFVRLFRHFGLPLPPRDHVIGLTRTPTIPYFNAGMVLIPSHLARRLVPVWGDFNRELAERPELTHPCERHLHQASLSLALAAYPVPFEEAPVELNYQLNATHLEPPEGFLTLDPAILHYHDLVDPAGGLLPPPYPLARMRSEMFNQRLRQERSLSGPARATHRVPSSGLSSPPPQIAVLGMHRAGTSAVTRLLTLMGLWAGPEGRFPIFDLANPKGYWENSDVVILDDALLAALSASWSEADDLDLGRLSEPQRCAFETRARELIQSFNVQGPWVIKDPRLCLLFPFWRRLLERPLCVLVHRDPLPVARSLQNRDGLHIPLGIALWELHARAALASSLGLPRVLISYHDLIAAPMATLRRLREELARLGVAGLREPEETAVRHVVAPALDRHPSDPATQRSYLGTAQLDLLESLESGAALTLDPVPPLSPGSRDTLAAHRHALAERRALRAKIDYRDGVIAELEVRSALQRREAVELQASCSDELLHTAVKMEALDKLLATVFASRSWRTGHAASRLFRLLFRSASPTAPQRWEQLRAEIQAWTRMP
jgi:hypothetical protein